MTIISKENWFILEGETKPTIECPVCGGWLLGDMAPHRVDENGYVHNSVVCRNRMVKNYQVQPCEFHDHVQLQGWDKGAIG